MAEELFPDPGPPIINLCVTAFFEKGKQIYFPLYFPIH